MGTNDSAPHVLLVGASRGLGLALAAEWAERGWRVTGTVRGARHTALHDLAERSGSVSIEHVDITHPDEVDALHDRLAGQRFDLLFVNAGVTAEPETTVAATPEMEFTRVMVTNALSPMRVVETLEDLVRPDGTIAVMSSGQGSVSRNTTGGHEVYRGSKAALNTFMRSYAARHADDPRTLALVAPGWVRTELGGPEARYSVEESTSGVADTLASLAGRAGLHYVDLHGETVPW